MFGGQPRLCPMLPLKCLCGRVAVSGCLSLSARVFHSPGEGGQPVALSHTASSMVAASAEPFLRVARRARRFVSRPKPVNSMDLLHWKVAQRDSYLVDPASSHMLVSKIKPCMSKYILLHSETANGSLNQLWFLRSYNPTWITVAILELIHATKLRPSGKSAFIRSRPIRDHSSRAPFLW